MKQAYVQNLGMLITEKCNMNCSHCMRGCKTNKNMTDEVINKTLDNTYGIGNLAICGGEPTMATDVIEKIFTKIVDEKKYIEMVSTVINGTIYSEEFLRLLRYIDEYISQYSKEKQNVSFNISYDDYHINEIKRLDIIKEYYESIKKYQESSYFNSFQGINNKLFNEGTARSLDDKLTVPLRPMPIYYTYVGKKKKLDKINGDLNIGPLISINPDGIITDCDASIKNQSTIYNYGNILTDSLEEICIKQGIMVKPKHWYRDCKKAINKFIKYKR